MRKGKGRLVLEYSRAPSWNFIVLWRVPLQVGISLMQNSYQSQEGSSAPKRVVSILHALRLTREGNSCHYAKNAIKCHTSCIPPWWPWVTDMPGISFAECWSESSSVDPLNMGSNREFDIPFPPSPPAKFFSHWNHPYEIQDRTKGKKRDVSMGNHCLFDPCLVPFPWL